MAAGRGKERRVPFRVHVPLGLLLLGMVLPMLWQVGVLWSTTSWSRPPIRELLALIMLTGALGGWLSSVQAFLSRVDGPLSNRLVWGCLLRPIVGAALALLVHFALRAALFPTLSAEVNLFGACGLSGVVGLFAPRVMRGLRGHVDALFAPAERHATPARQGRPANVGEPGYRTDRETR